MENKNDLKKALIDIKKVANEVSWFRDGPHRWPLASLPLAYAMACVEVVSQKSDKARVIYQQIIETWVKPGIKAVSDDIISEVRRSKGGCNPPTKYPICHYL